MDTHDLIDHYIDLCHGALKGSERVLRLLKKAGLVDTNILDTFHIGYANGETAELVVGNQDLTGALTDIGIVARGKEVLRNYLIIPVYDCDKQPVTLVGYSLYPQTKQKLISLSDRGIFNEGYLCNCSRLILTETPVETLLLIQRGITDVTFQYGADEKYLRHCTESESKEVLFTHRGASSLFSALTAAGVRTRRAIIDFAHLSQGAGKRYVEEALATEEDAADEYADAVQQIENGFLFRFPHLCYRVIGNFSDYALHMKANIKAFTEDGVFTDMVDLFKNRDRQNFIYNVADRFNVRDQMQLEEDLNFIIGVIENHKEKKAAQKKNDNEPVALTDTQKEMALRFLTNPNLIDEIDDDISTLGYVRERKNKLVLYLVMTSRLMDSPLHSIIVSRSSAGKSRLVEIIEGLCPPEHLVSISDLSAQAFYYFGENDLKNKFVVIGERVGSEGSDYPIRELISRRSITKAIPMKDQLTGEIKTERITVNGPIAYAETATSTTVNEENISRYFVLGVDETEEQTQLIHKRQRIDTTLEGYLQQAGRDRIREKHIYAGRCLEPIKVFNPFAPLLTFPAGRLKTRRDHQKFLRLIMVICFLHQKQRKVKQLKVDSGQTIEYIECTPADYRIAYDLLADGILDATLDDIPRQARELLQLIRKYVSEREKQDAVPAHKIIFTRKEIREYTGWTFVQIRNNFRILNDYEYIMLLADKKATAHQYRVQGSYADEVSLNRHLLKPEELEKQLKQ